jgi:glycosyltransferase involved in cell wall biosynthesis
MPSISIALATRNGETYLPAQLESLAAQTLRPHELVVTDDCSDDRTVAVVERFAATAPFPVRLHVNQATLGYRRNFLQAAGLCSGDLIAFCDQDDIWNAGKLAAMAPVFDDPDVMLAYHNATLIDAGGRRRGKLYRGVEGARDFPPLTRDPWIAPPGFAQIFRRDLMRFSRMHGATFDVDWPREPLAHDQWFVLLASVLGHVVFVRKSLALYRQHGSNTFGVYPDRRARLYRLARGETFIRMAARASRNRVELLERLQADLAPAQRERAQRGIAYYDALSRSLDARLPVYASTSIARRCGALWKLLRSGAYGKRNGSARFTRLDLAMDVYLAVPFGPRLQRMLPW